MRPESNGYENVLHTAKSYRSCSPIPDTHWGVSYHFALDAVNVFTRMAYKKELLKVFNERKIAGIIVLILHEVFWRELKFYIKR